MYHMNEVGSGVSAVSGGAGIIPTVELAHGGGHNSPCYYPVPMANNGNNCGNGFGGDGIWAILLFALLGRGGFGNGFGGNDGGGCAIPTILSDNINGRFSALSDQITCGDNSVLAAINQNGIVDAVRAVDANICAGFLQNANGFGSVNAAIQETSAQGRLDTCNSTGLINNNIATSTGLINSNINQAQFQTALGFERTNASIASCCCETNRNIDAIRYEAAKNTCDIINAVNCDGNATRALINQSTVQDLRDRLFEKDQTAQTCAIVGALSPKPPVAAYPVWNNAPIFTPTVSAQSFCGAPGTAFGGPRDGCGGGCGLL